MTGIPEAPPRGLRWTETAIARSLTTVLAFVAIVVAIIVGIRQQTYISCVADQQRVDATRTSLLAAATDIERQADRRLLAGPVEGGPDGAHLRAAAAEARAATDRVRLENPPPAPGKC